LGRGGVNRDASEDSARFTEYRRPPCQIVAALYKGVTRLQFKRRQSGQVKRRRRVSRGAQVAKRGGVHAGRNVDVSSPPEDGSGKGSRPLSRNFLLFDLEMEHFGAVFKLDLTEERVSRV